MGAIAGYLANKVAVKMIFWPHQDIKVLGLRVPIPNGIIVRKRKQMIDGIVDRINSGDIVGKSVETFVLSFLRDGSARDLVLSIKNPFIQMGVSRYISTMSGEQILDICSNVSGRINKSNAIATALHETIGDIKPEELERSVRSFFRDEFSMMAKADSFVGCFIGLLHGVMSILVG